VQQSFAEVEQHLSRNYVTRSFSLSVDSRRNLVGQLVPSSDIWLNDPMLMEFVRRQAAEEALVAARATETSDNPSTLT
jgi:hypothetical protein